MRVCVCVCISLNGIEMNRSFPEAFNPFTTTLTDLFIFSEKINPSHVFAKMLLFYSLSLIPLRMAISQQCEPAEQSGSGKVLKGHIFKSKRVQDQYECLIFCYSEFTCHSYNYVMTGNFCELNNRTKEARAEDVFPGETRLYV